MKPLPYKIQFLFLFIFLSGLFTSCTKTISKSSDKEIISFILKNADNSNIDTSKVSVVITADTIAITLPSGINLNGLIPDIKIDGVSISPGTGVPQDFTMPVIYTVTAQDGSKKNYVVIISVVGPTNLLFVGSSDNNFYALDRRTGQMKWKYTGGGWFSYASPTVYNGIVYAGCTDNNIYAFDAMTGNLVWKFATGGSIESSLSVADGVVYAGSDDANLYCLDAATGDLKWQYRTGANVSSSAVVSNGVVYFGSSDADVYALNIQNGNLIWKFATQGMINQSGATISNGVVFIGSRDGNLYAIDATTGMLKWKYSTNGISLEESSPTVSNGIIYIASWYNVPSFSTAGSMLAIKESDGTLDWQSLNGLGFSCSPYVSGNILYVSADDGNFYALNATTGSILWQKYILPNGAGATVSDGVVYIGGGGTHNIYAFDASSGNELWRFAVGSNGLDTSSPCVIGSDGLVYNPGSCGQAL